MTVSIVSNSTLTITLGKDECVFATADLCSILRILEKVMQIVFQQADRGVQATSGGTNAYQHAFYDHVARGRLSHFYILHP
jgi:hypothetical protein